MSGTGAKTGKRPRYRDYGKQKNAPKLRVKISPQALAKLDLLCKKHDVGRGAFLEKFLDDVAYP